MLEESDYTMPYDQYLATKESQDVPTEASLIPPTAAYMLQTLTDLTTQVEGHRKVNQEQALVNATLSAELYQCKLELAILERNKVKLECDHVIVARNKRNAELEQETKLLKTTLRNKEATIASLTSETKTVLSEKKTLEDKYLEEILSQPTLYDGHRLLQPDHAPVTVSDSHETLLETEVSRMKMSQKPGHVTPVDYTKLNALTHSRNTSNEKIAALNAEIAKIKPSGSGTKVSGPKTPEKPKVIAPGMYAISSKYITPPRQGDWAPPTPRKKHVTFQEPPRVSTTHTKQPTVNNHKQPNVNVIVSIGLTTAAEVNKPQFTRENQKYRVLPTKNESARRVEDHLRNLNKRNNVARTKTIPKNVRKTDITVAYRIVPQWNPTSRQFILCDIYGPKKSKAPTAKPLELSLSVVQIILWYLDSGCSRHMTGDRSKLINYVEKFVGTVRFGNDQFATIVGNAD
nr:retrovirus-related Pol polyprotein from transposon TNT 1-94 [Tanacetum cinerariifolium]